MGMGYYRHLAKIERLPLGRLWVFAIKQAWAALFGGLMLVAIIATKFVDLPWLARYDWLFLWAIAVQVAMIYFRLERPREIITIMTFHLVGLAMEIFKTSPDIGSWVYPEEAFFKVATVPLFSGFMYAAVGSYIARSWRVMEFRFERYPLRWLTAIFGALVYVNFFTHHYWYDIRWVLFAALVVLYGRTWIYFTLHTVERRLPIIVSFFLVGFFIWIAENIGTITGAWLYPGQYEQWHIVGLEKLGSWTLLIVMSGVMVDLLNTWYLRKKARTTQKM